MEREDFFGWVGSPPHSFAFETEPYIFTARGGELTFIESGIEAVFLGTMPCGFGNGETEERGKTKRPMMVMKMMGVP